MPRILRNCPDKPGPAENSAVNDRGRRDDVQAPPPPRPRVPRAGGSAGRKVRRPRPPPFPRFYRAMLCIRGTSHGPVSVCLSVRVRVRLSQVGVLSKRMNESGWFLARELHSTYPTLCYKEIHVPSKIRVPPSGILLQTLDLENFATAYRSSKRVINLARER